MIKKIKNKIKQILSKLGILYIVGFVVTFLIFFIPKDSKFDWKGKLIFAIPMALLWPYFAILGIKHTLNKVKA